MLNRVQQSVYILWKQHELNLWRRSTKQSLPHTQAGICPHYRPHGLCLIFTPQWDRPCPAGNTHTHTGKQKAIKNSSCDGRITELSQCKQLRQVTPKQQRWCDIWQESKQPRNKELKPFIIHYQASYGQSRYYAAETALGSGATHNILP